MVLRKKKDILSLLVQGTGGHWVPFVSAQGSLMEMPIVVDNCLESLPLPTCRWTCVPTHFLVEFKKEISAKTY